MILFRYLFANILSAAAAVTLILLLIVTSGRLSKYLVKASSGDLAADLVMSIILFRIPDFLPLIIPLGLFVGILLVYGRMYVDSEMVVLSACGASKYKILGITLVPAFAVSTLVAMLTLWGAPASLAKVQSLLEESKDFQGLAVFREGKFQASKNGDSVVYVEALNSKNQFEGVFVVEQQPGGMISLLHADGGKIEELQEADIRQVSLERGVLYQGKLGSNDYEVATFGMYSQRTIIEKPEEQVKLKIDALPTEALWGSDKRSYLAALHWRFSLPATVVVVSILAMALSETDRRRGRYLMMLPAIVIYLVYILSLSAARSSVEDSSAGPSLLWAIHAVYLAFSLLLLFRDEMLLLVWRLRTSSQ